MPCVDALNVPPTQHASSECGTAPLPLLTEPFHVCVAVCAAPQVVEERLRGMGEAVPIDGSDAMWAAFTRLVEGAVGGQFGAESSAVAALLISWVKACVGWWRGFRRPHAHRAALTSRASVMPSHAATQVCAPGVSGTACGACQWLWRSRDRVSYVSQGCAEVTAGGVPDCAWWVCTPRRLPPRGVSSLLWLTHDVCTTVLAHDGSVGWSDVTIARAGRLVTGARLATAAALVQQQRPGYPVPVHGASMVRRPRNSGWAHTPATASVPSVCLDRV